MLFIYVVITMMYLSNRGVVIVLDSVNFPKEKRNVAHLLISVLSEPIIQNRHIPVLIACNKQGDYC